jgi:hypothetical protein
VTPAIETSSMTSLFAHARHDAASTIAANTRDVLERMGIKHEGG